MKEYIKAVVVRAIQTGAEVLASFVLVGMAFDEIGWVHALSVAGVAMIASVLKSIAAGLPEQGGNNIIQVANKKDDEDDDSHEAGLVGYKE